MLAFACARESVPATSLTNLKSVAVVTGSGGVCGRDRDWPIGRGRAPSASDVMSPPAHLSPHSGFRSDVTVHSIAVATPRLSADQEVWLEHLETLVSMKTWLSNN
ncbi:hypothetical protein COCON_G00086820 [Conger conger]|uniref:Uncharacterized protein n=1 Tax=Conger conger TaxID=82655 RepID=A0A9Q1I0A6_CONCO|nr:hypothetical protein COCON_G00086820 [Conger conger]